MKLKEYLKGKLTKEEMSHLKAAYDILGGIAIIEIPAELVKKEGIIGESILNINNNVETVVKKASIHSGEFRLQKYKVIAGKRKKETEHKENNVRIKLHIEKTYFSARLSTERKRIMEQVKSGEDVLVMFSGCGPYVCVIAKNTKAKSVYGVEINPGAHKYALENVKINKLLNATVLLGDVRKIIPNMDKKFDRIAMPLPKSAEDFMDTALIASKKGTIIHFYDFEHENEIPDASLDKIKNALGNRKYKIIGWTKCGSYGPGKFRVCVDFQIL